MTLLGSASTVNLVLGATDMRKSINGLSLIVADHLERDVSFFAISPEPSSKSCIGTATGFVSGTNAWRCIVSIGPHPNKTSWRWNLANFNGYWTDSI